MIFYSSSFVYSLSGDDACQKRGCWHGRWLFMLRPIAAWIYQITVMAAQLMATVLLRRLRIRFARHHMWPGWTWSILVLLHGNKVEHTSRWWLLGRCAIWAASRHGWTSTVVTNFPSTILSCGRWDFRNGLLLLIVVCGLSVRLAVDLVCVPHDESWLPLWLLLLLSKVIWLGHEGTPTDLRRHQIADLLCSWWHVIIRLLHNFILRLTISFLLELVEACVLNVWSNACGVGIWDLHVLVLNRIDRWLG